MIIDAVSDLHGHYPELEGGDLLIVAGDLTARDDFMGWQAFAVWLSRQKYNKKIFIGGNHDNYLYATGLIMPLVGPYNLSEVEYLCDSGTEFEWLETEDTKWGPRHLPGNRSLKLKIWGSPWTLTFPGMNPHCKAFTVDTEEELAEKWAMIPEDVDILVTHMPPWGILDKVKRYGKKLKTLNNMHDEDLHKGSIALRAFTLAGDTFKNKKLHIFGHIHEQGGNEIDMVSCKFVNASHVNERYEPVNKPVRVIL